MLTLPLGGCLLAGDKPNPGSIFPPPTARGRAPAAAEARVPPLDWWRGFRSRELTEIIEERARPISTSQRPSHASCRPTRLPVLPVPPLLPFIDFNGNGTHSQQSKTTGSTNVISISRSGPNLSIINNNLTATLNASYEIDFGARTAPHCGPPSNSRSPAALTGRSSRSQPWSQPPTPISSFSHAGSVARRSGQPGKRPAGAWAHPAAAAGRHCVRARYRAARKPRQHPACCHPAARADAAPKSSCASRTDGSVAPKVSRSVAEACAVSPIRA